MKILKRLKDDQGGFTIPTLVSFIIVISFLIGAVMEVTLSNYSTVANNVQSQKAFNIAEAGINYYLWHLSHNAADYKDGGTTPTSPDPTLGYGPYVHNYIDADAAIEGTYTLWVKPAGNGSTIVTVRSIGQVGDSGFKRTIDAQLGQLSFANYGVVSDSALWFGNNETASGPVLSNQGVRMDGPNTSTVSSPNATYVPPDASGGDGASHPGVWCNTSVTSPVNCNTRDKTNWIYPTTAVDFNQVSGSLCSMKKIAFSSDSSTAGLVTQSSPCTKVPATRTAAYLPQRSSSYSLTKGYLITLNSNKTYDLSYVNGENDTLTPYTSALTLQSVATGIAIPSSGVIYAEDNVWVRQSASFDGRVSIAAGKLASASNQGDIIIVGGLTYAAKNGTDAIGLVADDSVYVAPYAPPASGSFNFEIDAAVLAENGNVTYGENSENRYPAGYRNNPQECSRGWVSSGQTFTFYGSVATRQTWTWNWLDGGSSCGDAAHDPSNGYISGIENTNTTFDNNLAYAPPPSYPTTNGFTILSWREVLTKP